jgi:hypothetical protein
MAFRVRRVLGLTLARILFWENLQETKPCTNLFMEVKGPSNPARSLYLETLLERGNTTKLRDAHFPRKVLTFSLSTMNKAVQV